MKLSPVYSGDLDVVGVSDGGSVLNEGGGPLLTAGTRGVGGGGNQVACQCRREEGGGGGDGGRSTRTHEEQLGLPGGFLLL